MTGADFIALLPLLIVFAGSVVVMLAVAVRRHHGTAAGLSFATLAAAFATLWMAAGAAPRQVTPLLLIDSYALYYSGLILAASAVVVVLSYHYLEQRDTQREEMYILLLVVVAGAMILAASTHFASFFLGVELLSVPLFAMIGYLPLARRPLEAAIKYLVLAAASVAFLVFGLALVYGELGTLELGRIAALLRGGAGGYPLLVPGFALIVTGIGFKLAVVPFHLWTPDVYEGAPAPVTAFIATVSKGAMVALLMRFFYVTGAHQLAPVYVVFTIIAIASMIAGNVLALLQNNVKRLLAYSSIAHLGYILVAFQVGGDVAPSAVAYYLAAYFVTILAAFGVISVLSDANGEPGDLRDFRGLFWSRPAIGIVMTLAMLSLAGIPLTAGFFGKYYVLAAGASMRQWLLVLVLVVTSAVGVYYYLRVLVALYSQPEVAAVEARPVPSSGMAVLVALSAAVVFLGVFPAPLIGAIRTAVASVFQ